MARTAHLRNSSGITISSFLQSNNYTITLRQKIVISFLRIEWSIISRKDTNEQGLVLIGSVVPANTIFFASLFLPFHSGLPLKKGVALHLNKLECHSPRFVLWQVWLKLAQWFWVYVLKNYYFGIISSGKWRGPSFEQPWIPFTQGSFFPSLVEIGQVVLEKKIFKFRQYIFPK